ncbi:PPA1309 family protein [Longimycelium tulufanense]|nr:PPA1309 family protein [Longimycelium tulufanense]
MSPSAIPEELTTALPGAAREVEDYVSTSGWEQPPQLFALVPTKELLSREPGLADQVDPNAALTPVAQDPLPAGDLARSLAAIAWPNTVAGCALAQEILVLPPEAQEQLAEVGTDPDQLQKVAAEHPERKEARLVAAVLRDGTEACVLRVRGSGEEPDQVIEHTGLAPNLTEVLQNTLSTKS